MKLSAYFFILLLLPFACNASPAKKPDMLTHHATHIITDGAAHIAAGASILAGLITAGALEKNNSKGFAALSALTGLAAAFYTVYKTPQWTDTYILNYEKKRNTAQNIIVFACRLFIPFPLGTLLGELEIHKNLVEAQ